MIKTSPKVDGYIRKSKAWQDELQTLRRIVLECGLTEEIKWRSPCYTVGGRNVVLIGRFKEWCVLSFVKGALLNDTHGILVRPGENTQSARVIRFTSVEAIVDLEPALKDYLRQAVDVEQSGLTFTFKKTAEFAFPEEFQARLDQTPALKAAFDALTPGRQRAYLLQFSSAKQSKTRAARVEKWVPQILAGKGIDDA